MVGTIEEVDSPCHADWLAGDFNAAVQSTVDVLRQPGASDLSEEFPTLSTGTARAETQFFSPRSDRLKTGATQPCKENDHDQPRDLPVV